MPLFCFLSVPSVRQARLPFCDMKLTLFCVSTTPGLLHDVFQRVSVHPIPIDFCYGLLSDVKDTNTFSLCVCVQAVSPSRQCNYAFPSHATLLFSFRAQRASGTLAFL